MLSKEDALQNLIQNEPIPIQINMGYWRQQNLHPQVLVKIADIWQQVYPERMLV